MGKVKQLFACSDCGRQSAQWSGKCPWCGSWGTVSEQAAAGLKSAWTANRTAPAVSSLAPEPEERRIRTGLAGVDRVLGGGLVPGSVVLLAGAPGIGKVALLYQPIQASSP